MNRAKKNVKEGEGDCTLSSAERMAKYKIADGVHWVRLYVLILGDCLAPSPEDYN